MSSTSNPLHRNLRSVATALRLCNPMAMGVSRIGTPAIKGYRMYPEGASGVALCINLSSTN